MVAATIAQASAIGNQGGGGGGGGGGGAGGGGRRSSNLQRFEAHNPPVLKGGGDSMVAGHCFRLVRKDTGTNSKRKDN